MRGLQGRGHLHDHLFPGQDKVNDTPRFRGWWFLSGLFILAAILSFFWTPFDYTAMNIP